MGFIDCNDIRRRSLRLLLIAMTITAAMVLFGGSAYGLTADCAGNLVNTSGKDSVHWDLSSGVLTLKPLDGADGIVDGSKYGTSSDSAGGNKWPWMIGHTDTAEHYTSIRILANGSTKVKVVGSASGMFAYARAVSSTDFSGFDTSQITSMAYMFACINTSTLDEGDVTLDISSFQSDSMNDARGMFDVFTGTESRLTKIILPKDMTLKQPKSDAQGVITMFTNNPNLREIENLNTFHVQKLEGNPNKPSGITLTQMFNGCHSLEEVDLSGMDLSVYEKMGASDMFDKCTSLRSVTVPAGFRLSKSGSYNHVLPTEQPIWYSQADQKYYSRAEVEDLRTQQGINVKADTYTTDLSHAMNNDSGLTIEVEEATYGHKNNAPEVKIKRWNGGTVEKLESGSYTVTTSAKAPTDNATCTVTGSGAYYGSFNHSFKLNKATPSYETFDVDSPDVIYDGQPRAVTVKPVAGVEGYGNITVYYYKEGEDPSTATTTAPVDVGTYISLVQVDGPYFTHEKAGNQGWDFKIEKKTVTLKVRNKGDSTGTMPTKVYDGTTNADLELYTPDVASGESLIFSDITGSYNSKNRPEGVDEYNYVSVPELAAGRWQEITMTAGNSKTKLSNYTLYHNGTTRFKAEITKRPLTVTISSDGKTYDGSPNIGSYDDDIVVFSCDTGLENEHFTARLSHGDSHVQFVDDDGNPVSKAGTWSLYCNPSRSIQLINVETDTLLRNYLPTYVFEKSTISPKELTISGLETVDRVYDGSKIVGLTGGSLQGALDGDDVSVTMPTEGRVESAAAGTSKAVSATKPTLSGSASGNYTLADLPALTVDITPKDIGDTSIEFASIANGTYSGAAQTPTVTVSDTAIKDDADKPVTLVAGTDYTVAYDKNTDAGTAEITITGAGNYKDTNTTTFVINPKPIDVNFTAQNKVYDGTTRNSNVTAQADTGIQGETLGVYVDYGSFESGQVAKDVTLTVDPQHTSVEGIDGTKVQNYKLTYKPTTADITERHLNISGLTGVERAYDGSCDVAVSGGQLNNVVEGDDVRVDMPRTGTTADANVGVAKLVSTVKPNLEGADAANYTLDDYAVIVNITPKDIGDSSIKFASIANETYSGSARTPDVTVSDTAVKDDADKPVTLVAGTDYTVAYDKNTDAGTADITITGAGNYKDTNTTTFVIDPKPIDVYFTAQNKVYDGTTRNSNVTAQADTGIQGETLGVYVDYGSFESGQVAKDVTLTVDPQHTSVEGIDGTKVQNYKLTYKPTTADITERHLNISGLTGVERAYDGSCDVAVSGGQLNNVVEGDDVRVDMPTAGTLADANVGEGKSVTTTKPDLIGEDIGNYVLDDYSVTVNITPKDMGDASISIDPIAEMTYTGSPLTPEPVVQDAETGETLELAKDYELSYENNTNAGIATVVVSGIGNYGQTKSSDFVIEPKDIASSDILVSKLIKQTYNGSPRVPAVTITDGSRGSSLVKGKDYTDSYVENLLPGKATAIYRGSGNYTGEIQRGFTVTTAPITAKGSLSKKLTVKWSKVSGASGYEIYVSECGKGNSPLIQNKFLRKTAGASATSATFSKLGKKKFSKHQNYKMQVRAYKMVNGKKLYLSRDSLTAHFISSKNKKYTNAKSVSARSSVSLKVGGTASCKAKAKKVKNSKHWIKSSHVAKMRYVTANSAVATVSSSGKITGVASGSTYVYAVAQNGASDKVKVTVK